MNPEILDFAYRVEKNLTINDKDTNIEKGFYSVDDVIQAVNKDLDAADVIGAGGNTLLSRQNLDAAITKLDERMTPLISSIARKPGAGNAKSFNRRKALNSKGNPTDAFYADNGLPPIAKPQYDQLSFPYARVGWTGGVSNYSMKAGESYGDLYAESVDATLEFCRHTEEWSLIHGNPTFTNSQGQTPFPGVDYLIQTNVIDALNQPLSLALLNRVVARARAFGGLPSHDYVFLCSYGQEGAFNTLASTAGDIRVNITAQGVGEIPLGGNIGFVQTTGLGKIPVLGDFFINPQGQNLAQNINPDLFPYDNYNGSIVNAAGNGASTIYLIPRKYLYMSVLQEWVREPLAVVKDGIQYFMKCYETPVLEAEPFCVKLINVLEPTF